jgi:hypothetical protein
MTVGGVSAAPVSAAIKSDSQTISKDRFDDFCRWLRVKKVSMQTSMANGEKKFTPILDRITDPFYESFYRDLTKPMVTHIGHRQIGMSTFASLYASYLADELGYKVGIMVHYKYSKWLIDCCLQAVASKNRPMFENGGEVKVFNECSNRLIGVSLDAVIFDNVHPTAEVIACITNTGIRGTEAYSYFTGLPDQVFFPMRKYPVDKNPEWDERRIAVMRGHMSDCVFKREFLLSKSNFQNRESSFEI